jgi:hypothetical protein
MLQDTVYAWGRVAVALVAGYAAFVAVAVGTVLDTDDRLIGRAIWSKVKGFLPTIDVGA